MRCMKTALVISLLFIALPLKAEGIEEEKEKKKIEYNVSVGIEQSFWGINNEVKAEGYFTDVVDYKTEGINLYMIHGNIKVRKLPSFDFHYERPLSPTERQKELLRINKAKESGSE